MAGQVSGTWARQYLQYSGARVWGTGINPVHAYYGSPGARVGNLSQRAGEITPPFEGKPDLLIPHHLWGYSLEDSLYTGVNYDDRPPLSQSTPRFRDDTDQQPSWDAPGPVVNAFRALKSGATRTFRSRTRTWSPIQYQEPSETVSEGWLNKPHGEPADSKPSPDSQLIVQTSMIQRYQRHNNAHAVARGTDTPRAGIDSRVTGQHTPVYSGNERHYDMFPRQADPNMLRAFWYRTAGTGRATDMIPNTGYTIYPIQRIPPAEPAQGIPETLAGSDYGYTSEDQFYA